MISEANRQLLRWYIEKPHVLAGDGSWAIAIGYLLKKAQGGDVSKKLARECEETLGAMRMERMREVGR